VLCGVTTVFIDLSIWTGTAPIWFVQTALTFVLLPATILAAPAIAFDITNKYDAVPPPGLFLYPLALLSSWLFGTFVIYLSVGLYLFFWVWPGR
jgi:hypothetical protein